MVNTAETTNEAAAAERALATGYAPAQARAALTALLALDAALGQVLRTTREPLLGQMRLAWWREALAGLDHAPVPAAPVLRALADAVLPRGVSGAMLSALVDGWEALLAKPLEVDALTAHGRERGARLFALAAATLGQHVDDRVDAAGEGWALADLARHLSDETLAGEARQRARRLFDDAFAKPWPAGARALGALALLARADLANDARAGTPGRVGRLLWHRLSGR